jgi:hypothetical protein
VCTNTVSRTVRHHCTASFRRRAASNEVRQDVPCTSDVLYVNEWRSQTTRDALLKEGKRRRLLIAGERKLLLGESLVLLFLCQLPCLPDLYEEGLISVVLAFSLEIMHQLGQKPFHKRLLLFVLVCSHSQCSPACRGARGGAR